MLRRNHLMENSSFRFVATLSQEKSQSGVESRTNCTNNRLHNTNGNDGTSNVMMRLRTGLQ
jgi:hypothetical protein